MWPVGAGLCLKFHPTCSKFGTIVHLGPKMWEKYKIKLLGVKGTIFTNVNLRKGIFKFEFSEFFETPLGRLTVWTIITNSLVFAKQNFLSNRKFRIKSCYTIPLISGLWRSKIHKIKIPKKWRCCGSLGQKSWVWIRHLPPWPWGAAGSLCNTVKSLARWGNLNQGPNKYFFKLALLHCPFKAVPVLWRFVVDIWRIFYHTHSQIYTRNFSGIFFLTAYTTA